LVPHRAASSSILAASGDDGAEDDEDALDLATKQLGIKVGFHCCNNPSRALELLGLAGALCWRRVACGQCTCTGKHHTVETCRNASTLMETVSFLCTAGAVGGGKGAAGPRMEYGSADYPQVGRRGKQPRTSASWAIDEERSGSSCIDLSCFDDFFSCRPPPEVMERIQSLTRLLSTAQKRQLAARLVPAEPPITRRGR
jgi:hypothetical protein